MKYPVAQIKWQNERVNGIAADYVLAVFPLPGHPYGRKALLMADLWEVLRGPGMPGVLWLDPDVAADPDDLAAMDAAVSELPADVHTGMVKLWPASTGRPEWIWSHRGGSLGSPHATQDETTEVAYIATGFLYTPARLLDAALPAMPGWAFIEVDVRLSELCLAQGIPMHAVPACRPKHLHF